jgi:hypothetical protein
LLKLCGNSLYERCGIFNSVFPNKKLTVYGLRRFYREKKIRKKMVRHTKRLDRKTRARIVVRIRELKAKVRQLTEKGFRIV